MADCVGEAGVTQVGAALQVVHVDCAFAVGPVVEHGPEQVAVGLEAVELDGAQGQGQSGDSLGAVVSMGHDLGHQ
jgi:hypothetical protein